MLHKTVLILLLLGKDTTVGEHRKAFLGVVVERQNAEGLCGVLVVVPIDPLTIAHLLVTIKVS